MEDSLARELEYVLPSIHRYPYKGRDDFVEIWDYELSIPDRDDYFLMTNINKHTFEHDFVGTDDNFFLKTCNEYCHLSQSLLIRMRSAEREYARAEFTNLISVAAVQMGLPHALQFLGSRDYQLGPKKKQADDAYVPKVLASRPYPSVVLEVAWSESASKLRADAERWLTVSNGEVKAAITILVKKRSFDIIIQRWNIVDGALVIQQETRIMKQDSGVNSRASVVFIGAPFIIPFHILFLRPAAPSTNEGDIVLADIDLIHLARDI